MKCMILLTVLALVAAEEYVDKEYMIGLKAGSSVEAFAAKMEKIELKKSWDLGMTVLLHVSGEDVDIERISNFPEIKYVERNGIMRTQQCQSTTHDGVWGLDRIDQQARLPYTEPNNTAAAYEWGASTGAGVIVYVLDTGIQVEHTNFGGRAVFAYNSYVLSPDTDNNGHGTHCAGTIGSTSYGVAKDAAVYAVKVLTDSGSGTVNGIVEGIDWVRTGYTAGEKKVVSMSLGGGASTAIDDAVAALVTAGVPCAVAAGNDNGDACVGSPARAPTAVTVGASDVNDASASFTNYGTCVDIFAPGVSVLSTWLDQGTNRISGTSMACPHVAGVIARYQSSQASAPTPDQVTSWLTSTGTRGALTWTDVGHDTSPNLLVYAPCAI